MAAGQRESGMAPADGSLVAGIDGCRGGWILATIPLGANATNATTATNATNATNGTNGTNGTDGTNGTNGTDGITPFEIRVIDRLDAIVDEVVSCRLVAAGIDIPMGLPPRGARSCDVAARRMLGRAARFVFPSPARAVLAAETYEEACALSRQANGTAISKQLFNILPKIREADRVLARSPELQRRLVEMCPELSFTVLAGAPMCHAKRAAAGRAERLAVLRPVFGDLTDVVAHSPAGAAPDDVLDALVGAWTARRFARRAHLQLGGEVDETGLTMAVVT